MDFVPDAVDAASRQHRADCGGSGRGPLEPDRDAVLVVRGDEVRALLAGLESRLVELVREAYLTHHSNDTVLPHSSFVQLRRRGRERAIALPAFLGGRFEAMGIKWIASFPDNPGRGLERASGVIVLNSLETGRPLALLEGSIVSVKRTAASAVLAASRLGASVAGRTVGLIGCGPVNLEVLRLLSVVRPGFHDVLVFDTEPGRARRFAAAWRDIDGAVPLAVAAQPDAVFEAAELCSIATSATEPHIASLGERPPRVTLHLSLRDLAPEVLLGCRNVVDDVDHVLRAETSLHRAERATGGRTFIWRTLGALLASAEPIPVEASEPIVFSPFGLGILDIAVAQLVYQRASERGLGLLVPSFFPGGRT